jgi:hypothetical protein
MRYGSPDTELSGRLLVSGGFYRCAGFPALAQQAEKVKGVAQGLKPKENQSS